LPDPETRLAIWKEATRKIKLAKTVDLARHALEYPLTEPEIWSAVKLMTGPGAGEGKKPQEKRQAYDVLDLKEAIFKTLAYDILAQRSETEDKEKEGPCEKIYEYKYPHSWCLKKKIKEDFSCRGEGGKQKDFICEGTNDFFFACSEYHRGKEKFACDASKGNDKFECTREFWCDSEEKDQFYCVTHDNKFECQDKGESQRFSCAKGKEFYDKCYPEEDFLCDPKKDYKEPPPCQPGKDILCDPHKKGFS